VKVLRNSGYLACWRLATRNAPQAAPRKVRGEGLGCLAIEVTEQDAEPGGLAGLRAQNLGSLPGHHAGKRAGTIAHVRHTVLTLPGKG
jgi:hypothetical protein